MHCTNSRTWWILICCREGFKKANSFKKSLYFPTYLELDTCLEETGSCNEILLDRIEKWTIENEKSDQDF